VPEESDPPFTPAKLGKDPATTKTYTVIKPPPATAKRLPNAPPKVISHKELLNRVKDVQCYDAVPVNESEDAEVEKFIPMLEEYLKLSDTQQTSPGATSTNDYVWDIFLPPDFKVHGLE